MPDSGRGMVHRKSIHSFAETLSKLESVIAAKGIPMLAQIDHAAGAAAVGLAMRPATVLIFGNAKAGTPLMVAAPTLALDLPLKALVWEDADLAVWVSYNAPEYLRERHQFPESMLPNIAGIVAIVDAAVL